jgi:hypothetical protein
MKIKDLLNSKLLKVFIKRSLIVIGLSIVLFFSIVILLLFHFNAKLDWKVLIFIIVLAIPLIIFLLILLKFLDLIKSYYDSSGNTNKESLLKILKIETIINMFIKVINNINLDSEKENEIKKIIREILELLLKISKEDEVNDLEYKLLYDKIDTKMLPSKSKSDSHDVTVASY